MELLVAMTLLGILMTALFGGLRLGTRVWETSEMTLHGNSHVQTIRWFLRDRLEETLHRTPAFAGDGADVLFKGERTVLRFASRMPISLGTDFYLQELLLQQRQAPDRRYDLVLRWRSLDADRVTTAIEDRERVMIADVAELAFSYFGAKEPGEPPAWHNSWQASSALPGLIKVDLRFPREDRRRWPPFTVSPMVDEWYVPSY